MIERKAVRQHILDTAQPIVGSKGFSAVGLNEVLQAARVPKGSFYHYFASKDAFGEALLEDYFDRYLEQMQHTFSGAEPESEKLLAYWRQWTDNQTAHDCSGKCLAVKLGAEVADLSEAMRQVLDRGTARIIECLTGALTRGQAQGSLQLQQPCEPLATQLYALWLGASVMAKITRSAVPFNHALAMSQQALGTSSSIFI